MDFYDQFKENVTTDTVIHVRLCGHSSNAFWVRKQILKSKQLSLQLVENIGTTQPAGAENTNLCSHHKHKAQTECLPDNLLRKYFSKITPERTNIALKKSDRGSLTFCPVNVKV